VREKPGVLNNAQKKFRLEMLRNASGFALDSLGKYKDALKAFESARRSSGNGNVKVACCGKGLVFIHLGDWEKALKAFDRILAFNPENIQASVMKAFVLIRLQKFEDAASSLKGLAEEGTYSDLPACLMGFACSRLDDFERALWAYKKAIEINPKNFHARNGLAELYFRLGNSRGSLRELEASITEAPDNAFSRNLKGRVELEEQACADALESFMRALDLDSKDRRLLLWDAYARYMYAETSFEEENARFRHLILGAARKLEKAALSFGPADNELKAYALYFMGLFYCRARYFRKASGKLEECLRLETPTRVIKPASLLLKSIRTGPLRPTWWEWWLDSETHGLLKKAGFGFIILLIFSFLPTFSWASYGREYLLFILLLLAFLLIPEFRFGRWEREELELEVLTPPAPDFDIPASILDEFTERLEKNLFSPEPMEERVQKLVKF
jgi:tetratricopeptide (TPR) repeat protein